MSVVMSLTDLQCLCSFPAHDTGLVTLQVAVSGQIISNSVVFEYKARALPALPSSQHDWLSLDGEFMFVAVIALSSACSHTQITALSGNISQNRVYEV